MCMLESLHTTQIPSIKPNQARVTDKTRKVTKKLTKKIPATILHRDVRQLVVLIPAEEQTEQNESVTYLGSRTSSSSGRWEAKKQICVHDCCTVKENKRIRKKVKLTWQVHACRTRVQRSWRCDCFSEITQIRCTSTFCMRMTC